MDTAKDAQKTRSQYLLHRASETCQRSKNICDEAHGTQALSQTLIRECQEIINSAQERCQHAQHICEEAAMIRERARELQHMSQFARHRRKKQRARSGFSRASVVEGSQRD